MNTTGGSVCILRHKIPSCLTLLFILFFVSISSFYSLAYGDKDMHCSICGVRLIRIITNTGYILYLLTSIYLKSVRIHRVKSGTLSNVSQSFQSGPANLNSPCSVNGCKFYTRGEDLHNCCLESPLCEKSCYISNI